jgi:hypothetical protein
MSFDESYSKRSDTRGGYDDKIKKMKRDAYAPQTSRTGYGQPILGMDDVDRIRRDKLKD